MYQDSSGQHIRIGDIVRFRGKLYQIAAFRPGAGRSNTAAVDFTLPPHTDEVPDELSVDLATEEDEEEWFGLESLQEVAESFGPWRSINRGGDATP